MKSWAAAFSAVAIACSLWWFYAYVDNEWLVRDWFPKHGAGRDAVADQFAGKPVGAWHALVPAPYWTTGHILLWGLLVIGLVGALGLTAVQWLRRFAAMPPAQAA